MARKFKLVKASIGDLLATQGQFDASLKTLATPVKIHAFQEVDTETFVYGFEADKAGAFHIMDKSSFDKTVHETINGFIKFSCNLTDTVYTAAKLTDGTFDSVEFAYDAISPENISDVPTDINLKTGVAVSASGTTTTTPATGNTGIASWAWYIWVGIGVAVVGGILLVKKGFGGKKKVISK
jgi:hypothetical protein